MTYGDISEWSVTTGSMAWTIANKGAFDGDITFWDASSVNNLSHSFASAHAFNQPLNVWDTSVTNLDDTFDKQFAKTKLAESAKSAKPDAEAVLFCEECGIDLCEICELLKPHHHSKK